MNMPKKTFFIVICILVIPAFFALAQDGTSDGTSGGTSDIKDESVVIPPEEMPIDTPTEASPQTIESALPGRATSRETPVPPAPIPDAPAPVGINNIEAEPIALPLDTSGEEEEKKSNVTPFAFLLLAVAVMFAALSQYFLRAKKAKNKQDKKKDDSRCFNIKKLMEDKLNEATDLRGKIEGSAKDKARGIVRDAIEGTPLADIMTAAERAEKEYNRFKKLYEKCTLELAANKQVFIVHGCPSDIEKAKNPETRTYDKHWLSWLKNELVSKNIKTEIPLMPNPWAPDYDAYKKEFEKYTVGENTILIGHSCGCAFLVRWLGETKKKIAKLILVAPWKIPDSEPKKEFYEYPIDETIKSRIGEIVMFTSDDEEVEGKESLKIFHEALGGEVIELKGRGHYTKNDMGTEEFPELLEVILK